MYFRGLRRRQTEQRSRETAKLTVVSETGFEFFLKFGEYDGANICSGHVLIPSVAVEPITQIAFSDDVESVKRIWRENFRSPQHVSCRIEGKY